MLEIDSTLFCTALRAVVPHASTDEDNPMLWRVQLRIAHHEAVFTAASGQSAILVRAGCTQPPDPDTVVHLRPTDVQHVVKLFKPPKDVSSSVRVTTDPAGRVTIAERDGLFDGRALELPAMSDSGTDVTDIAALIAKTLRAPVGEARPVTEVYPAALHAITTTAGALGDSVVFEATTENGPLLVRVGDRCIGLVAAKHVDEDQALRDRERVRGEWSLRLPGLDVPDQERFDLRTASGFMGGAREQDGGGGHESGYRELLAEAATLVITTQFASTSMLQRKLRIGHGTADRVMDDLEAAGVVTTRPEGGGPRDVITGPGDADDVAAVLREAAPTPA
jgi:hypothetical protein